MQNARRRETREKLWPRRREEHEGSFWLNGFFVTFVPSWHRLLRRDFLVLGGESGSLGRAARGLVDGDETGTRTIAGR
jgi:hypothetical protein